ILNAAGCMRKLNRHDEALDLLEGLLRAPPAALSDEQKENAQRALADLRGLVGTIEITRAEPGAVITIDGRARGAVPSPGPLRVVAGSHVVRVTKDMLEPFETRVEVAGGQTVRVVARLLAPAALGELRVTELRGRVLEVIVDGAVVGNTPYNGRLAPGLHIVW